MWSFSITVFGISFTYERKNPKPRKPKAISLKKIRNFSKNTVR